MNNTMKTPFAIFCRRTALRGGNDNIARDVQANGNLEH